MVNGWYLRDNLFVFKYLHYIQGTCYVPSFMSAILYCTYKAKYSTCFHNKTIDTVSFNLLWWPLDISNNNSVTNIRYKDGKFYLAISIHK